MIFPVRHAMVTVAWISGVFLCGCAAPRQSSFDTPDQAVGQLLQAVSRRDRPALQRLFGPDLEELASGDQRQDQADFQRFAAALQRKRSLTTVESGAVLLQVGEQDWAFPAPLVRDGGRWRFDTAAGVEEMLDRRIGRNELDAMGLCRLYVDAQREYFEMDPDGDGVRTYAAVIGSAPGTRDGLYWPDEYGVPESPLGPLMTQAIAEGELVANPAGRQPYRGYYYKILTSQGAGAAGGARSYIDEAGRMTRGFALVAWPADYGQTGIMTFIVSAEGKVYEKDLGEGTAAAAEALPAFDPQHWTPAGS